MVQTRSEKKTAPVEGIVYSTASEEEIDSLTVRAKVKGKQADDGIDPQIYAIFKKMMNKMLAEQA